MGFLAEDQLLAVEEANLNAIACTGARTLSLMPGFVAHRVVGA
jgi:hypothetical protein